MKDLRFAYLGIVLVLGGLFFVSADHIDAPAVSGGQADITDFYAFQGQNTSNMVFVANVQGLLSPMATQTATFDENVLIEINIDNDGDNVEDLVIQAIPRNGKMYFFGPEAPSTTGSTSTVLSDAMEGIVVDITAYSESAVIADNGVMKAFAGPRDDPFFMDFAQFGAITGGTATGFNDPGADTFAGTNVMSLVIEVPKSMIGSTGTINTWVEAKQK